MRKRVLRDITKSIEEDPENEHMNVEGSLRVQVRTLEEQAKASLETGAPVGATRKKGKGGKKNREEYPNVVEEWDE